MKRSDYYNSASVLSEDAINGLNVLLEMEILK